MLFQFYDREKGGELQYAFDLSTLHSVTTVRGLKKKTETDMDTQTPYRHIVRKSGSNEPAIQGTRITVRDIVENWKLGKSPEEIPAVYPHISLAQVFEALAFYQDNQDEIESFIQKNRVPDELSGTSLSR